MIGLLAGMSAFWSDVFHSIAFFEKRVVYLQFKELNINSYTVCKTYRGCAALTGAPPLPLKFKVFMDARQ